MAITLLFSTLFLCPTYADNDTVADEVNVTIPISCTLSGTGMDSHVTELQNTESDSAIGEIVMKAYCNDSNGFSIYAIGFTDDEYGKTVLTDSSLASSNDIITGTSTSGPTSNWAMKLSTITSPTPTFPITIQNSFDAFHNVPSTYTKVAERTSSTDIGTGAEGSTLKSTYQAYISSTQSAGTFVGQVKYTLVHPYNNTPKDGPIVNCPANRVCYSPNANDIEGTMGQQSISNTATSVTFLASNYSRNGYGFAGWSDKYDYATNNEARLYGPNETISFTAGQYSTTNGGLRLYAIWIESAGSIQDSTKLSRLCGTGQGSLTQAPIDGTADLSSVSALTDQRDNETYAIAKLADGNCWIIENLRLEAEHTRSPENIALAQGYGASATYGNFIGLADAETANFANNTSANSLYSTNGSNGTVKIGGGNSAANRIPRYNNTNTQSRATSPTNATVRLYGYGNYYNWPAAIADTTFYDNANHDTTSICPSGWRLPVGTQSTASKGFGALSVALGGPAGGASAGTDSSPTGAVMSAIFRKYPNNFVYAGWFNGSSVSSGNNGYYQSSNSVSDGSARHFHISGVTAGPGTGNYYKFLGRSIRCVTASNY